MRRTLVSFAIKIMAPWDQHYPDTRYLYVDGKWVSAGSNFTRGNKRRQKLRNIAVLDVETDPFDNKACDPIFPFLAIVYSDQFEPIQCWNNDWRALVQELTEKLEALPEPFTIYAHNGGRFDYMYFMHLIHGHAKFKGRALMSAKLGKHEIRDSLHIIPESLRNASRKTDIDYRLMHRDLREKHREEITRYCMDDCHATFDVVRAFIDKFGMPLTIGQAAMKELKKHYQFKKLTERSDRYMRQWFFGGRVECISKPGKYDGPLKLYDVNSMYPAVMATVAHPIGDGFMVGDTVTANTAFIHLRCRNRGALLSRLDTGELTANKEHGEFYTTIHEYKVARELGLIEQETILKTVDFWEWTKFDKFVLPLYEQRAVLKAQLDAEPNHPDRKRIEQDLKFYKYLLNNAYGKFAQNPRKFKDYFLTPPDMRPPEKWLFRGIDQEAALEDGPEWMEPNGAKEYVKRLRLLPAEECDAYTIWERPNYEWRFNNVATAASITGAARAKLVRAIHCASGALYCDTDSLVCRDLTDHDLHPSELGAWKHEATISSFIMAGKKLYGFRDDKGKEKIRAKGMNGVTWHDLEAIVEGAVVAKTMLAPTLTRAQGQHYMTRELRMTA